MNWIISFLIYLCQDIIFDADKSVLNKEGDIVESNDLEAVVIFLLVKDLYNQNLQRIE